MGEPKCKHCTHFHQHYVIDSQCCTPINCGHCTYPRLKRRTPATPACVHFSQREGAEDLPDRREIINFLTKDMLEHILSLPLPPVVGAADEGFDCDFAPMEQNLR